MSFKYKIFSYVKNIIDGNKKGFLAFFIKSVLYLLSKIFSVIIYIRNFLYDKRLIKQIKVKPFIISIGNIVVGGTGKTPFTIYLAKKLSKKHKVAIATRGYGKKNKKNQIIDKNSQITFEDIGDEPYMMRNNFEDITFLIGKNRAGLIKQAESLGIDVVILDDGFQYRKLKKDLEIAVINADDPYGKNYFLPRGYLRDNKKSLNRADFFLINNFSNSNSLQDEILKNFNKPIICAKYEAKNIKNIEYQNIFLKKTEKIAIFSSIANPKNFKNALESMGFEIVNSLDLSDHEKIKEKKLFEFIEDSIKKDAKYVLTTEKDIVKLPQNIKTELPIYFLQIDLNVVSNSSYIDAFVEKIATKV
ncbi:MAG: tetraacyldisaccharide 4'-kinase [Parachlamydiales bacterium]|nr:tetraacyldisaccharide 4'-kinase [Parachlamydiales bacterium]